MKISNMGVRVLVLSLALGVALSDSDYYCSYTIETVYQSSTIPAYTIISSPTSYEGAINSVYGTSASALETFDGTIFHDLSLVPITIQQPDEGDTATGYSIAVTLKATTDTATEDILTINWDPLAPTLSTTCLTNAAMDHDISGVTFALTDDLTIAITETTTGADTAVSFSVIIGSVEPFQTLIDMSVGTLCAATDDTALDGQAVFTIAATGYVNTVTFSAASSYDLSTLDRFADATFAVLYPGSYSTVASTLIDEEIRTFVADADTCFDVSTYTFVASDANTADVCPTTPENERTVACTLPAGATTDADCTSYELSQSTCCWDSDNSYCRASDAYRCSMDGIDATTSTSATAISISGTAYDAAAEGTYDYLYPGETVTFSCSPSSGKLFAWDDNYAPDSDTETILTCAVDDNGDVTDIATIHTQIGCMDPCVTVVYDDTLQTIDPVVSAENPQRWGSEFTLTCNNGYGFSTGGTTKQKDCRNSDTAVDVCYRCDAPIDDTTFTDVGSFSADSAIPTTSVTYTCNVGYSITGSTDTSTVSLCQGADGWETDWTTCEADCVLVLVTDGDYAHTGSDDSGYLAIGDSVTLGCAAGSLPVTQSADITCSTAGETITPEACQTLCEVSTLKDSATNRNLYSRLTDADAYASVGESITEVAYGTQLQMECEQYYSVQWSDINNLEFECSTTYYEYDTDALTWSWSGVPTCYETCQIQYDTDAQAQFDLITIEVGSDTSQTVTWDDYVSKDTQVKITCTDDTYTVKNTPDDYQILTCDDQGTVLRPTVCVASCEISDLPAVTSNTAFSPAIRAGYKQNVEFSCTDGYYMGNEGGSFTVDDSFVECEYVDANVAVDVQFNIYATGEDGTIPTQTQCYAYPTISSAVAAGAETIDFVVEFDSARDTSVTISSVVVTSTYSSTDETCTATADSDNAYSCTVTSAGSEGIARSATAKVTYAATYTDTDGSGATMSNIYFVSTSVASLYPGPKALDTTDSTASVVGKDSLTIALSTSATDAATAATDNAEDTYSVTYTVAIYDDSISLIATMTDLALSTFTSPGVSLDISSYVSTMSSYTVTITPVISSGGTGGEVTINFATGLEGPIVASSVTHSTENVLTITLGGGATLTGSYDVSINGDTESLDFTDGVATKTLSGLTALADYSYDFIVYFGGIPSPTTTKSWTQGPTEPEFGDATRTNAEATVTWALIADNTYYLNLYLQGSDGSYPTTATDSYTTTVDTTSGSYTFSGLTAGATYKVTAQAEMTVDSVALQSSTSEKLIDMYSCASADKVGSYILTHSGDAGGVLVSGVYLNADANTVYVVSCPSVEEVEYSLQADDLGTLDNTTACIGPNTWGTHSDCLEVTEAVTSGTSTGVITGIIIAVVLILVVIIIIVILIKRRKSTESSSTKKYSPRDEEKNNEVDDGGEAWRNPYYQEHDEKESPDIPDNRDANGGDNISQEAQINFNDEDEHPYDEAPEAVVISNNAADDKEQV